VTMPDSSAAVDMDSLITVSCLAGRRNEQGKTSIRNRVSNPAFVQRFLNV
jgi:hypothetical protein